MAKHAVQTEAPAPAQALPDPLPLDPFPLFKEWLDEAFARKVAPNPNAMALATVGENGLPSVRTVLCKDVDLERGYLTFYTNYRSPKGRALEVNPRAGVVFHWDTLDRQVRMEGPVTHSPAEESDAYFASRPLLSRLAAWASDQSEPIASHAELVEKLRRVERSFGVVAPDPLNPEDRPDLKVPRPPHWGGARLWPVRVELWVSGAGRLHDRAHWTRRLEPDGRDGYAPARDGGRWLSTRLQP